MPSTKILLVDDEPDIRELLSYNLASVGYDVKEAENGEVGIQIAESWHPDLGLLCPEDFDIVIQATPVGMAPQVSDCVDFPFQILTARHFVLDLIYNPTETTFLQRAAARGARTQNGLPMLFWQAEGAWSIWIRGK